MSQKRYAADALEPVTFGSGPVEARPVDAAPFTIIKGSKSAAPEPPKAREA